MIMALNVAYKYKVQVPEMSQRKLEGLKVKRRYPSKIPVTYAYSINLLYYVGTLTPDVYIHVLYITDFVTHIFRFCQCKRL